MSDLTRYVRDRKRNDADFKRGYDAGYEQFKIGVMLRKARENAGLTQEDLAQRMRTRKSAISRIENHAENITLTTLEKYAEALGKRVYVSIG